MTSEIEHFETDRQRKQDEKYNYEVIQSSKKKQEKLKAIGDLKGLIGIYKERIDSGSQGVRIIFFDNQLILSRALNLMSVLQ